MNPTFLAVPVSDPVTREAQIKDILTRGKIARFTNQLNGVIKDVNEWNPDADGDLTAFRRQGGSTNYVCPVMMEYVVTEVDE